MTSFWGKQMYYKRGATTGRLRTGDKGRDSIQYCYTYNNTEMAHLLLRMLMSTEKTKHAESRERSVT